MTPGTGLWKRAHGLRIDSGLGDPQLSYQSIGLCQVKSENIPHCPRFRIARAALVGYDCPMPRTDNEPFDTPLERSLAEAVRASEMSTYLIAQASGVSAGNIYSWLAGKRSLTVPVAGRIAETLGLDLLPRKRRYRRRSA